MSNTRGRYGVAFAPIVMMVCVAVSHATILEDHFGVTLSVEEFTDYCPVLGGNYTRHVFSNDWTPSPATAEWIVNDYKAYWSPTNFNVCAPVISGGEPYDVEALYFDNDLENIYLSVVTSFPGPAGHIETRLSNILVVTGDLALDFGLNGAASGNDPFNYDYGVNLNNEKRQVSGNATAGTPPALGGGVYRTANSDWYTGTTSNAANTPRAERTNFDPAFGSFSGTFEGAAFVEYELIDFGTGIQENFANTYVIGAKIPFTALHALQDGDTVGVQWVMGCRNDGSTTTNVIRLDGEMDIPEPGVLGLFGLGIVGIILRRRFAR